MQDLHDFIRMRRLDWLSKGIRVLRNCNFAFHSKSLIFVYSIRYRGTVRALCTVPHLTRSLRSSGIADTARG